MTLRRDAGELEASGDPPELGRTIGRFVLLQRLGRGGMGVVHAAYDPELDRRVAIKLVVSEMQPGSASSDARLVREAQAMARLSHPNVAHVYEVGQIDAGFYIAMEYVDGRTLGAWATEQPRGWREIVDVFVAAGHGIAAAHDAGLVHRDIKPDNIMIDRRGRVLVLDFGLATARAAAQGDAGDPARLDLTAPGSLMGTPRYMAPEQFAGGPVDRRADVYAFCVALWETLYGAPPVAGRSLGELAENVAAGRIVDPAVVHGPTWLHAALRRGLARDPEARWPDMRPLLAELARDRRAPLRRALTLAAPIVALAIGATFVAGWLAPVPCTSDDELLAGAWDEARRDAVRTAFAGATKSWAGQDWPDVEARLDAYAADIQAMRVEACEASRIHGRQSDELLGRRMACLDRRVRRLGAVVQALAEGSDAAIERAADVVAALPGVDACADVEDLMRAVALPEDASVRASVEELRGDLEEIDAFGDAGRYDGLGERIDDVLARARATGHAPLVGEVLLRRGKWEIHRGRADAAAAALDESLDAAERSGHDVLLALASIESMTLEARLRGRFDVADVHARRATALIAKLGDPTVLLARLLQQRGQFELLRKRSADALAVFESALSIERTRDVPSPHADVLHREMAVGLIDLGRLDEADEHLDRAFELAAERRSPGHPDVLILELTRARLRRAQGHEVEAVSLYRAAASGFEASLGPGHMNVGAARNGEGLSLTSLARDEEAVAAFEAALAIHERELGHEHPSVAATLNNLGTALTRIGRTEQAIAVLQRALAIKRTRFGAGSAIVALGLDVLGDAYLASGDLVRARDAYRESIQIFEALGGAELPRAAYGHFGLGRVALAQGDRERAIAELEQAVATVDADADSLEQADLRHTLAQALAGRDDARAAELEREARALYARSGFRGARRLAALTR